MKSNLSRDRRALALFETAFILMSALAIVASCGSSVANRALLSDASFDRCFDMDFNPDESPGAKSHCWREWLDTRYEGETDDKIRYAEMRRAEIAQGLFVPGPPSAASTYAHRPRLFDTEVFSKKHAPDGGETESDTSVDTDVLDQSPVE